MEQRGVGQASGLSHCGCIVDAVLTSGNLDDRGRASELAQAVDGCIVLVDLGYDGPQLADLLSEQTELLLITRRDVPEK